MSTLVRSENVKKHFDVETGLFHKSKKVVHAVDGVSLEIGENRNLALVGESGCGKTTFGKLLAGILRPTCGTIQFMGHDFYNSEKDIINKLRRNIGIIFQDPLASLNPRKNVLQILTKPLLLNKVARKDVRVAVLTVLEDVGLSPAERYLYRFPHEFSGGQRQRIAIARATICHPKFIIADEPVSSLDMSVKGKILNSMNQIQEKYELTYLFVTHDLSVARSMSKEIAVMYLGKLVELAEVEELYTNPVHPYTQCLLSAFPILDPKKACQRKATRIKGEVPSPIDPPSGCRFHPRCPSCKSWCHEKEPELTSIGGDHLVACHSFTE